MQEPSLFTRIIDGEIPSHKVYEDELTLAFLTINPVRPGHVLVVPKVQVDHIWDLDDETYEAMMATVKKVGLRIREVLKPVRVGVHVAGMEVPHAHVHIFPFDTEEQFWTRPGADDPDHEALAAMAERLRL